jgi:hypothetical protein
MSKKKIKKTKPRRDARAMPLAIAEYRLQQGGEDKARRPAGEHADTLPVLFPLRLFFRQQAMLVYAFSNMLRFQQQAADVWLSPFQRR